MVTLLASGQGRHRGQVANAASFVRRIGSDPSAFITYIPKLYPASLSDANAILLPSGDQDGASSIPGLVVSRVTPVPSGFMTYTSVFCTSPARGAATRVNASCLPSGDQAGAKASAVSGERLVAPEPSAFITYTCERPSLLEVKAILVPSGENTGAKSVPVVVGILAACEPSEFIK